MGSRISGRSLLSWLLQIALLLGPLTAVARGKTAAEVVAELQKLPASERQAFLEAGAQNEGSLVLYGTTAVDHQHKISLAFRRRYPFLEVKLYRAGTTALLRKIITEAQAGRLEADVINIAPGAAYEVKRLGLIEKYLSPNREGLREGPRLHEEACRQRRAGADGPYVGRSASRCWRVPYLSRALRSSRPGDDAAGGADEFCSYRPGDQQAPRNGPRKDRGTSARRYSFSRLDYL